jgi:5-formyltetrahydrofolate cyclo-ligase
MNQPFQTEALVVDKRGLRAEAAARREAAHREHGEHAVRVLAGHGLDFLDHLSPLSVSGFFSVGSEIDISGLLSRLSGEGWSTALPVIIAKAEPLLFRAWRSGDPVEPGRWNIPAPPASSPEVLPDVLLVPLLAYDATGHRLGYGGGFYDRTIAKLRALKPIAAVGVAYSAQEVAELPAGPFDQRLDWILTERGPHRFGLA